jgi:hypothetical protein
MKAKKLINCDLPPLSRSRDFFAAVRHYFPISEILGGEGLVYFDQFKVGEREAVATHRRLSFASSSRAWDSVGIGDSWARIPSPSLVS